MKKILFFVSILTTFAFTSVFVKSTSVVIASNSKLIIKVETNVNSINCEYNVLKLNKPIPVFYRNYDGKLLFDNTTLVLSNANFDCGGIGINNDFKKLLKTDKYPQIFINLKQISTDPKNENSIRASLDMEIAGIKKSYVLPIRIEGEDTLLVKGDLILNLRDFNIEPPKKALGLIVVKDSVHVNFQLLVKEQ